MINGTHRSSLIEYGITCINHKGHYNLGLYNQMDYITNKNKMGYSNQEWTNIPEAQMTAI